MNTDTRKLIERAVTMFGSQKRLADAAGVSQPVISEASRTGRVGVKLAIGLHRATGGAVNKVDLRPDLFRDDPPTPSRNIG